MPSLAVIGFFSTDRLFSRATSLGLLFIPVVAFAAVIGHHATNIPRDDDLFSLLPFLRQWAGDHSWSGRFGLLFEQYYSHRIVLTKFAAALDRALVEHCDMIWLQACGWFAWLGIAAIMLHASNRVRQSLWLGLPVVLVLMQPQGASNFLTAMQAVQNLGVLLIAFTSLTLVVQAGSLALVLAFGLALLAPLASVNGLLVFPVAVAGLALQRRRRSCLAFALGGIATWALFFLGDYSNPQVPFSVSEFLQNAAVMTGAPLAFGTLGIGFATFAGGAILVMMAAMVGHTCLRQRPSALTLLLLFVALSIAMAARGRIGWGAAYMEQDRYRVYGVLALALLYLMLVEHVPARSHPWATFAACIPTGAFCLLSYANYLPAVTTQMRWTQAMPMNRQLGQEFLKTVTGLWGEANRNWVEAAARGDIRPPALLSPADLEFLRALESNPTNSGPLFTSELSSALCGYGIKPNAHADCAPPEFAAILYDGRPVLLPVDNLRTTFWELVSRRSFYSDRFRLILPETLYRTGRHRLIGLSRNPAGNLFVLWHGIVSLP